MKIFTGFDRVSTEEEINQVLDILGDPDRNGWVLHGETADPHDGSPWNASHLADSSDFDRLADILEKRPELKN